MKRIIALTMCLLFAAVTNSFAQTAEGEVAVGSWEDPGQHVWEIGPQISYIKYEEKDVMEQKGMMYGVACSYTYRRNYMLRGEVETSFGQVDYESANTGTLDDINDYMFELRALGGYDFSIFDATTVTPFTGLGYRYLYDDSGGRTSSTGAWGYMREANYTYSPLGVEVMTDFDQGWSLGLTLEYDYFWGGLQISHLSDVSLGFDDLENTQEEGYGARASLRLKKQGETFGFIIEPFVRYWDIDDSETDYITYAGAIVGYGYEPKNSSTEFGVKCMVTF